MAKKNKKARLMNILKLSNINIDDNKIAINLENKSIEEKVKLSILNDLIKLNWNIQTVNDKIELAPPTNYDKDTIRKALSFKKIEIIQKHKKWIDSHLNIINENLVDGNAVLTSKIEPYIEICKTNHQHNIFRMLRYYWSSAYSDYVGRRIRLLIRDASIPTHPIIGIAALGSPIIHIPDRDKFIGWNKETRSKNLIHAMDAYVIGALPPYNYILGGKLIAYILTSKEIRDIYKEKYLNSLTLINKRVSNNLVCLFTTGLFGKSSQYNRIKYKNINLYQKIGETKGYGSLHLSEFTIDLMKEYLKINNISVSHKFGDGPSWKMRLIRTVGDKLNFNSNILLNHSFKRYIYYIPYAEKGIDYLNGKVSRPRYYNWSLNELVNFWKVRWLEPRKRNLSVIKKVIQFKPENFNIYE